MISLNAVDGSFDKNFGSNGLVRTGLNLLPPVIYKNQVIIATLSPDHNIESYNVHTGKLLWKLRYKETFSKRIGGVRYDNSLGNPWGGSSLDVSRGIFYIATGNPSYYFDGSRRPGPNKDANSIIAIDLNQKKKIWSFGAGLGRQGPPGVTCCYRRENAFRSALQVPDFLFCC